MTVIVGTGPGGALSDKEAARVYGKAERTFKAMRLRGEVPPAFYIGKTPWNGAEAIAQDINRRAQKALRQSARK